MTLESSQNEHLEIEDKRILLPESLNSLAIRRFHKNPQCGHFATGITTSKVLNHFWIPRLYPNFTEFISKCLECQLKKKSVIDNIKPQRNHIFTNQTNYPLALLYLDHYGKLPLTEDGNEYILTARDNFTKFVWLIPCKDTK